MDVRPVDGLPNLPEDDKWVGSVEAPEVSTEILIAGAGPAGLRGVS
jgi:hypothetical protein